MGETCKIEAAYQLLIMDISVDQSATPTKGFWRTWRREIIRGGVLFGLVVGTGLFHSQHQGPRPLTSARWARSAISTGWTAMAAICLAAAGKSATSGAIGRSSSQTSSLDPQYEWSDRGRGGNGPTASRSMSRRAGATPIRRACSWSCAHRARPYRLRVVGRNVTAAATRAGDYKMSGVKKTTSPVRFTVQLPRNVSVDVST